MGAFSFVEVHNTLRERESIDARLAADETLALAHPRWLLEQAAWPQHWRAIAQANNARPPLTLRVNRARTNRADYLARLAEAGIGLATTQNVVPTKHGVPD